MRSLRDLDAEIRATELRLAHRRQELNRDLHLSRERTRRRLASPAMLMSAFVAGFVIERLGRIGRTRRSATATKQAGPMAGVMAGLAAAAVRAAVSNPQMWASARALWEKRKAHRHDESNRRATMAYDGAQTVQPPFSGRK